MWGTGIDCHKRYSVVSIQDGQGRVVLEQRVDYHYAELFEQMFRSCPEPVSVLHGGLTMPFRETAGDPSILSRLHLKCRRGGSELRPLFRYRPVYGKVRVCCGRIAGGWGGRNNCEVATWRNRAEGRNGNEAGRHPSDIQAE
jgi:hypothetical protein